MQINQLESGDVMDGSKHALLPPSAGNKYETERKKSNHLAFLPSSAMYILHGTALVALFSIFLRVSAKLALDLSVIGADCNPEFCDTMLKQI